MVPGGVYNPGTGWGNTYGSGVGSYGNRYPNGGGSVNGPFPGAGIFPQDPDGKSSLLLPLAGAALLGNFLCQFFLASVSSHLHLAGIATYALVANPGMMPMGAMGKRRKRSLFDKKILEHLAYRAHQRHEAVRNR